MPVSSSQSLPSEAEAELRQMKVLIVAQPIIDVEPGIQMYAFDLKDAPDEMIYAICMNEMERYSIHGEQIWLDDCTNKPIIKFHDCLGWINVFRATEGKKREDEKAFSESDLKKMQKETDICWKYIASKLDAYNLYKFWEPNKFIIVYQVMHCSSSRDLTSS